MKKRVMSVILSSLLLMGAVGGFVKCVVASDDPPILIMNTQPSTLALSDDPPILI